MCFLPGRNLLITASMDDGTIKLWDIYTSECVKTIEAHKEGIGEFHHNQKRSIVVTAGEDSIKVWDDRTFEQIGKISISPDDRVRWLSVTQDGTYILYATCQKNKNIQQSQTIINILDIDTSACVEQFVFSRGNVRAVVLCENQRYMVIEYYIDDKSGPGKREYLYVLYDRETQCFSDLNNYKVQGDISVVENIGYLVIQKKNVLCVEDPVTKRTVTKTEIGKSKILRQYLFDDGILYTAARNGEVSFTIYLQEQL